MSNLRTRSSEASVRHLHAYLLEVKSSPAKFIGEEMLSSALASQGALAHFDLPELGITAMSLNTAKRVASSVFEGEGYAQLNRLRLECVESLAAARSASVTASVRETKKSLRDRAKTAERQIGLLSEDLQLATGLLRECMGQARAYAKRADAATQARCEKEQRDVFRMLSLLRSSPIDHGQT